VATVHILTWNNLPDASVKATVAPLVLDALGWLAGRYPACENPRKPPSTCTAVTPSPPGGHTMELSTAGCSVRPTVHASPYHALSTEMTQHFFVFVTCDLDLWPDLWLWHSNSGEIFVQCT